MQQESRENGQQRRMPLSEVSDEAKRVWANELLRLKETSGWKILMVALSEEAEQAKEELALDVDAKDADKIECLQREVKRLIWFRETIDLLIIQGLGTEAIAEEEALNDDQITDEFA